MNDPSCPAHASTWSLRSGFSRHGSSHSVRWPRSSPAWPGSSQGSPDRDCMNGSNDRSFLQALFAFLALPGMVAFVVPWLLRPAGVNVHNAGIPILVIGIVLLLWCVRDFYIAGRGTLAPWAPPKRLVIIGLYRRSRN